jgi:hypothetical protein
MSRAAPRLPHPAEVYVRAVERRPAQLGRSRGLERALQACAIEEEALIVLHDHLPAAVAKLDMVIRRLQDAEHTIVQDFPATAFRSRAAPSSGTSRRSYRTSEPVKSNFDGVSSRLHFREGALFGAHGAVRTQQGRRSSVVSTQQLNGTFDVTRERRGGDLSMLGRARHERFCPAAHATTTGNGSRGRKVASRCPEQPCCCSRRSAPRGSAYANARIPDWERPDPRQEAGIRCRDHIPRSAPHIR